MSAHGLNVLDSRSCRPSGRGGPVQGESVQGPSPSVLLRCSQGQVQSLLAAPPVEFIWENPVAPEESGARWKRSWQELLEHSWEPPNVLPFHPAVSCVPFSACGSDELWYVGTGSLSAWIFSRAHSVGPCSRCRSCSVLQPSLLEYLGLRKPVTPVTSEGYQTGSNTVGGFLRPNS